MKTLTRSFSLARAPSLLALSLLSFCAWHATAQAQPEPAPLVASAAGRIDPALVGRWVRESVINSPGGAGGFASFATQRSLTLAGDGRARQTQRSAGGGSQWSHASEEQVEFSGRWQVRGAELWVMPDSQTQFIQAARYALFDRRLVVYTAQGRQIWSRF